MIIFPAIDIQAGQVVRLRQGDPTQQTVYSPDPLGVARTWRDAGATHIHIVNLDGALGGDAALWPIIEQIAALGLLVQFGGGLRTADDVQQALESGVNRAVIGTAAVQNPEFAAQMVAQHGREHIVIALDSKDGQVATHGWQAQSAWPAVALAHMLREQGIRHVLYTDILRDGELGGVNLTATLHLAQATGLSVVASGGVRSLEDVRAFVGTTITGVILGKALYEGMIDLTEAVQLAEKGS